MAPAIRIRRGVEWAGVIAATVLFWSWVLMEGSRLRDAVALGCAVILLALVGLVMALRALAGQPEQDTVLRELGARAASREPLAGGLLPGRLRGGFTRYLNQTLMIYATILYLITPLVLGVGNPVDSGKAPALKKAGVSRGWLPVERVLESEKTRTGRSTTGYDNTVHLRLPGTGRDGGAQVRITHRLITGYELRRGDNVYVAYAPSRPGLGVFADNDKEWVERRLSGRALDEFGSGAFGLLWVVGVGALLITLPWTTRSLRFPRRLKGDEHALRARMVGHELRPNEGSVLLLSTDVGEIPLFVSEHSQRHFTAAGEKEGWLVWHPERNRRRGFKAPNRLSANFVGDAGWHIPGELTPGEAESAATAVTEHPGVAPSREAALLDIQRAWPLTVPPLMVRYALGMAFCSVVLTLPIQIAGWRIALGLLGTFAPPLIGFVTHVRAFMAKEAAEKAGETTENAPRLTPQG